MFYTVFSTNDTPYMQWQSDLLEYTWKRVGQEGTLVRLVATDDASKLPKQKYAHCIATQRWDNHPDTGDFYPVYNKPASLLEWVFKERPEGTVLLLDPDCVFRAPVTQHVSPGHSVAQKWIDLTVKKPSKSRPFGLSPSFKFLDEFCVQTDLSLEPVMIPTLIHTSDLRRIAARWLQLCSAIRQSYRNAEGRPIQESDMFAYLVATAEYGLHHEPVPLGVCTNWPADAAPDAPIIHYCQPIKDRNDRRIFFKQSFVPWTRVDDSIEAEREYGRDLVTIVNDFIDDRDGVVRPAAHFLRPQWCDKVMEGRLLDDILLEIPSESAKIWLNGSGKAIWELCDGTRTVGDIGEELAEHFEAPDRDIALDAATTIGQLRTSGFLTVR